METKTMKRRVTFDDSVEVHHIDGDECRLNYRYQQTKHMIKYVPVTMALVMYLPLDLYKKFEMEVHPLSKSNNSYKIINDLEASFGRPFESSDVNWLLEGVSVLDDSFYALARSYQYSERKIRHFYKKVLAVNRESGNKHHNHKQNKQEPCPRGRVLTIKGSGSASNRGRGPRRQRQMPSTSTSPLATRKHEDSSDVQMPNYIHGGKGIGRGTSIEFPHQCHEPEPAHSLSTIDPIPSSVKSQGKVAGTIQTPPYASTSAPDQSLALSSTFNGLTLGEAQSRSSAHSSPLEQSSRSHLSSTAPLRAPRGRGRGIINYSTLY